MKTRVLLVSLGVLALLLSIGISSVLAAIGMERVSLATDGTQGDSDSSGNDSPSISADGRYVAFDSLSSNLVPGDTNGFSDVFVRDRQTNTTTRVSLATDGTQGDSYSDNPSISADGRYIAFRSNASNLVPGDTNGTEDIFVRDRQTNTTTRVSVASDGTQGNDFSDNPSISADGRYVAFESYASNLVPGDTNATYDIFVRDRQTNTTTRVSVASDGTQGNNGSSYPSISADGRYVAFASIAGNLVPGDTNGLYDIFVRDRQTNTTTRVSVATDGTQGNDYSLNPHISADGRYIAFESAASNLVPGDTNGTNDIFVRDRQTNTTTRVNVASDGTQGNGYSAFSSISADGRYVAFASYANNLVPGDTNGAYDVFVATLSLPPAHAMSISPNQGTQGQTLDNVIITGNGFIEVARVSFGDGITVNSYRVTSYAQIRLNITIAPGAMVGPRNVSVTSLYGSARLNNGFMVIQSPPATTTSHSATVPATPQGPVQLPAITVQSASLSSARVAPGTPVTVTANVANTGAVNGSTRLTLYVNGQEESGQGITVNSGSSTPVTFSVSRNEPGAYAVYVGGTNAGSFIVEEFAGPGPIAIGVGLLLLIVFAAVIIVYRSQRSRQRA
jgi:Tol biopolymer transport system component